MEQETHLELPLNSPGIDPILPPTPSFLNPTSSAPSPSSSTPKQKPPRVIYKLDADKLLHSTGLPYIYTKGKKIPFKGKGHEAQDLKKLLTFYRLWAHELIPKLQFRSFLDRCQRLCKERRVKIFIDEMRKHHVFGFNNVIGIQDNQENEAEVENDNVEPHEEASNQPPSQSVDWITDASAPLSEEQLQQINSNRERALAKLAERQRLREMETAAETAQEEQYPQFP